MERHFKYLLMAGVLALANGCGYTLQNSRNPLADREGVRKVFVSPLVNSTFKPGIENTVYNSLIKTLAAHRRIVLVTSAVDADAVLGGTVTQATSVGSQVKLASDLNSSFPLTQWGAAVSVPSEYANYSVAWEYQASLSCAFTLNRKNPRPGQKITIWTASFARSKPYPASNQLGPPGTTSALINESEFERALSDLADSMMADVHESMLAMF